MNDDRPDDPLDHYPRFVFAGLLILTSPAWLPLYALGWLALKIHDRLSPK